MAERPGGYIDTRTGIGAPRLAPPDADREAHQELTPAERTAIENNFRTYLSTQLGEVPADWDDEKKVRHIVFEYAYDNHRAEYHQKLEGEIGRIRKIPGVGNAVANTISWTRNFIYRHVPVVEHAYNFAKEGALAYGAARTVGYAANLLNITAGPASWLGAAAIGGTTGALVGYRRGGERYVTKNLNAEKLGLDFEIDELVQKHGNYFEHLQLIKDPRHVEGRRETGEYFSEQDYARAAEVMEKLNQIASKNMIRGDQASRAQLADQRAYLAAILEQRDFFDAISHRTTSQRSNPGGAPTGQRYFGEGLGAMDRDRLAKLWLERQEYRQQHSLAEQYKDGVSEEGKKFMEAHRAAAKKASWKGALTGGVTGAIFAGTFSYFFGERTPHGFGKHEVEGVKALENPMNNRDFGSLARQLEHVAVTQQNTPGQFFDANAANAANDALHRYGLPNITHYVDPKTGTNYLFEFLNRAHEAADPRTGEGLTPEKFQQALYNFLSHYDHAPTEIDPVVWHDKLANILPFDQLADPDYYHLSNARQQFIDQLRLLGKLNPVAIANITGFATQSPAMDYILGAAGGYLAGAAVGQGMPAPEVTSKPLTITAEQAAARGKPLPEIGQHWEILAHAANGQAAAVFQRLIHAGLTPPFYLRVDAVAGQRASVTFVDKEFKDLPITYPKDTISYAELIRDEGYQYRNPAVKESAPKPTTPSTSTPATTPPPGPTPPGTPPPATT